MAKNETEVRFPEGYMTLYKEGLTTKDSSALLAKFRANGKKCRRVQDNRVGKWVPSLGRYLYCIYVQSKKGDL